jgi:hypothetical protein
MVRKIQKLTLLVQKNRIRELIRMKDFLKNAHEHQRKLSNQIIQTICLKIEQEKSKKIQNYSLITSVELTHHHFVLQLRDFEFEILILHFHLPNFNFQRCIDVQGFKMFFHHRN